MPNTHANVMSVRQILVDQIKVAQEEVDRLMGRLASFDEMFNIDTEGDNPRPILSSAPKTAAPKPATAPVATVSRTPATTAPKGMPKKTTARSGAQPPIPMRIVDAMGKDELNASQIFERLEAANALPASNNQKQYISFILSKRKDLFESVRRGMYRVRTAPPASADSGESTEDGANEVTEEEINQAEEQALIDEASEQENMQADASV